jgi:MFS family permease
LAPSDARSWQGKADESRVYVLFAGVFTDYLGNTMSFPVLPYFAREFGATNSEIAYLYSAWNCTSTAVMPFVGALADRHGRRLLLLLMAFGSAVASFGLAFSPDYLVFLSFRGLSGLFAAVGAVAQIYLTDVCPPEKLRRYMAAFSAIPGAALIFGPVLGGLVSDFGLHVPFIVDGVCAFSVGVLVYFCLPESKPSITRVPEEGAAGVDTAVTPLPFVVYPVGLSNFLVGMSFAIVMSMLAISLEEKFNFSPKEVGYTMTGAALVMLTCSLFVTPFLQKKIGVVRTAVSGSILNGLCLYMYSYSTELVPALFVYMLSRAGSAVCMASRGVIHASICDATNRGKVFGSMLFCMGLGRIFGPMFTGFVIDPRCGANCTDRDLWPWHIAAAANLLAGLVLTLVPKEDALSEKGTSPLDQSADLGERLIRSSSSFDGLGTDRLADELYRSAGSLASVDLEKATVSTAATVSSGTPQRNVEMASMH